MSASPTAPPSVERRPDLTVVPTATPEAPHRVPASYIDMAALVISNLLGAYVYLHVEDSGRGLLAAFGFHAFVLALTTFSVAANRTIRRYEEDRDA